METIGLLMLVAPAIVWTAYSIRRKWVSCRFVAKVYAIVLILIGWYMVAYTFLKAKP